MASSARLTISKARWQFRQAGGRQAHQAAQKQAHFAGTPVAPVPAMTPEALAFVVGGLAFSAVIVRYAARALNSNELSPLSTQWIVEQRGRRDTTNWP